MVLLKLCHTETLVLVPWAGKTELQRTSPDASWGGFSSSFAKAVDAGAMAVMVNSGEMNGAHPRQPVCVG